MGPHHTDRIPGSTTVVVGISGTRRTSPFKTGNIAHAVSLIAKPRATRGGGNDISFLPSINEFLGCENPKDFEALSSEDEDFPTSILWELTQSFWLHPLVFQIADGNSPIRAADLALAVMQELSGSLATDEEMDANKRAKEVHNLLLSLWAVEKSLTTKVALGDPPSAQTSWTTVARKSCRSSVPHELEAPPPEKNLQAVLTSRSKEEKEPEEGTKIATIVGDATALLPACQDPIPDHPKNSSPGPGQDPDPTPKAEGLEETGPTTRIWRWS
jgi:hypothetical protein